MFCKQKTAYDVRISDWSSDVCSSDLETRNSNVGVWFNHEDTASAWTDGPIAGPIFYSEHFGAPTGVPGPDALYGGKDLSYSGALTENRAENKSLGFNLEWEAPGGVTRELDAHHSTAHRSEERRVGKGCVSTGKPRWAQDP